jgi:hypothetical protein
MSIRHWLSILAISTAALTAKKARAEEVVQPVVFVDPIEDFVPGRKIDANLAIQAVQLAEKQNLHLSIKGNECEIVPGSCKVRLALPHSIDIQEIKQEGWKRDPRTGKPKEKIDLFANEKYQRAIKVLNYLGEGVLGKATGLFGVLKKIDDLTGLILTGQTRSEKNAEELRRLVHNMSLLDIPEYAPQNPLAPQKYFCSRNFDFVLSSAPELSFAVISLSVADKNHRTYAIQDLVVSFNDVPKRELLPIRSTNLDNLLLSNDPNLRLRKRWSSQELSGISKQSGRDFYALEYGFNLGGREIDFFVFDVDKKHYSSSPKEKEHGDIIKTYASINKSRYGGRGNVAGGIVIVELEDQLLYYMAGFPQKLINENLSLEQVNAVMSKLKRVSEKGNQQGRTLVSVYRGLEKLARSKKGR